MKGAVTLEKLKQLHYKTDGIRNICIVAHVDHGKTTLADALVASNGIISNRLAGKLRYMDSRKDEQERGITMKSSSIALYHNIGEKEYLINLIDSPGHVDFSSEVSTAIRLCDGAVVLVDVIEGVCPQTLVALKQAWKENIKPVLVLNKIDRLILELKLSPLDAYVHLTQLLEKVNVVMAELFATEHMEQDSKNVEEKTNSIQPEEESEYYDWNTGLEDADDSNLYFLPEQGDVVFASATDGWGFRVEDFAKIYSKKLGMKEVVLNKTLWGNFYLNTKQKRVMKGAQEKAKKPLFVQLILENIWAAYDAIAIRKDRLAVENIVKSLSLTVHPRDLKQTDFKSILHSVMGNWLPLSRTVLDMVCSHLPSPLTLSESKIERLMLMRSKKFSALPPESQALKENFLQCSSSPEAPVIIFISKMFPVETMSLPEHRPKVMTADEIAARRQEARNKLAERLAEKEKIDQENLNNEIPEAIHSQSKPLEEQIKTFPEVSFIAFSRVFSGTLKVGQKLYLLGPKHDPALAMREFPNGEGIEFGVSLKDRKPGQHVISVEITSIYLLMGRELESLREAPAGSIVGIGGLDDFVLKTATLSSSLACPPFTDITFLCDPILRVALEPRYTSDMDKLRLGLKLLNQADPCVQVLVQETGEHVIVTAGEVHLQKCLDDLRERFAKIEISVSSPIVPFRETIIEKPKFDMVNEAIVSNTKHVSIMSLEPSVTETVGEGVIVQLTPDKHSTIKIKAIPLPESVVNILDEYCDIFKIIKPTDINYDISEVDDIRLKLSKEFEANGWEGGTVDRIWSFGPKHCGPNILFNNIPGNVLGSAWPKEFWKKLSETDISSDKQIELWASYNSNFVNGFQLATIAGPLCEEPMRGVAFSVLEWSLNGNEHHTESGSSQPYGPFSGQIMSAVKEACRKAFQVQPQRLMVAMYSCNIQVNSEVLGRLYAVLGKRGGRILHGDLQEGSTVFEVTAQLPVIESFDFANEVRRQTSGLALPQLVFSGWETLDIDPFWQPTTEEEYLHFGDKADSENIARKYLNSIRRRKGLHVEEKIVEFGEKQRTLTKNK